MKINVILASSSPRRKDLLERAGVSFVTAIPDVNEDARAGESPMNLVKRLSKDKAQAVRERIGERRLEHSVILAADTIVVAPDGKTVLGKPRDFKEARAMLRRISGKTHQVYTGYCLMTGKKTVVRAVCTKVKIRDLGEAGIERYLSAGESMDKAGAYAAQGYGMTIIESIIGSYTNVVGLPVAEVLKDIKKIAER